jgi:Ca-activated chloride channel family protein
MHGALRSVFLQSTEGFQGKPDVLLITDGQIWEPQHLVPSAKVGGHRIYIVGVGASAAEAGLRQLAQETGGACEFVTPGEDLQAAAHRMIERMHHLSWQRPAIRWGVEPSWQTALPQSVRGGDTVIAFAGFESRPESPAVRLTAVNEDGSRIELARNEAAESSRADDLVRVAAWTRLSSRSTTDAEAAALATDYQLMTSWTKCVFVHSRAEANKTVAQARFHKVAPMLAAGFGATSTVQPREQADFSNVFNDRFEAYMVQPILADIFVEPPTMQSSPFIADSPRRGLGGGSKAPPTPFPVLERVLEALMAGVEIRRLAERCSDLVTDKVIQDAINQTAGVAQLREGQAWLLLAVWINEQWPHPCQEQRAKVLNLASKEEQLDESSLNSAFAVFDRLLGHLVLATGSSSRSQRLARVASSGGD